MKGIVDSRIIDSFIMYRSTTTVLFLPCGGFGDELRYQAPRVEGWKKIVQSDTVVSGENDSIGVMGT